MSRPWILVVLLLLIVFTSQLEWKEQFGLETEAIPSIPRNDKFNSRREESVKEKIILSQEKNIQKLHELVRSLQEQLQHCRTDNSLSNNTTTSLTEHLNELER